MIQLTKAEEQVMQIVWSLGEGTIKDVLNEFEDPKPAYNTVATVLKILKNKEFVEYKVDGTTYVYYPLITKESYSSYQVRHLLKNYFNGSFTRLATFFAQDNNMSLDDLEAMLKASAGDENENSKL